MALKKAHIKVSLFESVLIFGIKELLKIGAEAQGVSEAVLSYGD